MQELPSSHRRRCTSSTAFMTDLGGYPPARGVLRTVASLGQQLLEPRLAVRKVGLGDGTGQSDPLLVRNLVQNIDGGAITQKDAFGVDGN